MDCCAQKCFFIAFFLIILPVQGQNINCNGKPFYCVNSTHFKICVDLGGGISSTVDDFLIPCPSNTFCEQTNQYECEYRRKSLATNIQQSEATNEPTTLRTIFDEIDATGIIPLSQKNKKEFTERFSNIVSTSATQYSTPAINTRIENDKTSSFLPAIRDQKDERNISSFLETVNTNFKTRNDKIHSSVSANVTDDILTTNEKLSSPTINDITLQFKITNITTPFTYEINEVANETIIENNTTISTLVNNNDNDSENDKTNNRSPTTSHKEVTNSTKIQTNTTPSSLGISEGGNLLNSTSQLLLNKVINLKNIKNNSALSPLKIKKDANLTNLENNKKGHIPLVEDIINLTDFKNNISSFFVMDKYTDPTNVYNNYTTSPMSTLPLNINNKKVTSASTENFTTPSPLVNKEAVSIDIKSNIKVHSPDIMEIADPTNLKTSPLMNITYPTNFQTNIRPGPSSTNNNEIIDQAHLNDSISSPPLIITGVSNAFIFQHNLTTTTSEANEDINLAGFNKNISAPDLVVHNMNNPKENKNITIYSLLDFKVENQTKNPENILLLPLPMNNITDSTYTKSDNTSWNRNMSTKNVTTYPTIDQNSSKPFFPLNDEAINLTNTRNQIVNYLNIIEDTEATLMQNNIEQPSLLFNKVSSPSEGTSTLPILVVNKDVNLTTNLTYTKTNITSPFVIINEVTIPTEIKNNVISSLLDMSVVRSKTNITNDNLLSYQKTNKTTESTYNTTNINNQLINRATNQINIQSSTSTVLMSSKKNLSDNKNNITIFPYTALPSSFNLIKKLNSTDTRKEVTDMSDIPTENPFNLLSEFTITKTTRHKEIDVKGKNKLSNSVFGTFPTEASAPDLKSRATKNSQLINTTPSFTLNTLDSKSTNTEDHSIVIDKVMFNETILKPITKRSYLYFDNVTETTEIINISIDTETILNYSKQPHIGLQSTILNNLSQSFKKTAHTAREFRDAEFIKKDYDTTIPYSLQSNAALLKESGNKPQLSFNQMKHVFNNTNSNILTDTTYVKILSSSTSPYTKDISTIFYNTLYLPEQSSTESYTHQDYTNVNNFTTIMPSERNQTLVEIYSASSARQDIDLNKTLENKTVPQAPNLNMNVTNMNKVLLSNLTTPETLVVDILSKENKIFNNTPVLNEKTKSESQYMPNIFDARNESQQEFIRVDFQSNSSYLKLPVNFSKISRATNSTKSASVNMEFPISDVKQTITTNEPIQMTISNYITSQAGAESNGINVNLLLNNSEKYDNIMQNTNTPIETTTHLSNHNNIRRSNETKIDASVIHVNNQQLINETMSTTVASLYNQTQIYTETISIQDLKDKIKHVEVAKPFTFNSILQNKTNESLKTTDATTIAVNTPKNLNSFDLLTTTKLSINQETSDKINLNHNNSYKIFNNESNIPLNKYEESIGLSKIKVEEKTNLSNKESNFVTTNSVTVDRLKIISPNIKGPHVLLNNSLNKIYCLNRTIGRYPDQNNCTKFYICMGSISPLNGECPVNTVFSDVKKLCTKNLSHCVRNNQFRCLASGRYYDIFLDNTYYICVQNKGRYIKFKFQCQHGYSLNKTVIQCIQNGNHINSLSASEHDLSSAKDASMSKESNSFVGNEFRCKSEGKFADPNDCKKYYVCSKNNKSEFRRRRKSCDIDKVWRMEKQKCVDEDSYECKINK